MEKVFNIRVFPPPPPPSFNASLGVYEEERVSEKGRKGEGDRVMEVLQGEGGGVKY